MEVTGKRGSISAISAISKSGFLLFELHDGRINSDKVIEFLEKMRKQHPNRHLYIFMDNAPVHTANKIKDYEEKHKKIHIENIPRYWPKYNPDEFVWNYLKNVEMNVYSASDKEDLKEMVTKKLEKIASCTKTLKGIFYRCKLAFHL
ncbi:MAG: transposase [Spirochaetota bacterium]